MILGNDEHIRQERAPDYGGLGGPLAALEPPTRKGAHPTPAPAPSPPPVTTKKPSTETKKPGSRNLEDSFFEKCITGVTYRGKGQE